jgi:hypothetical protein
MPRVGTPGALVKRKGQKRGPHAAARRSPLIPSARAPWGPDQIEWSRRCILRPPDPLWSPSLRCTDAMRRDDERRHRRQLGARRDVRRRHHTALALPGDAPSGGGGKESAGGGWRSGGWRAPPRGGVLGLGGRERF